MGHRGAAALAPENTLAAVRAAARAGLSWVELDVRLTRNGHPVLSHDATLARAAGRRWPIALASLEKLRSADVGGGERLPTLGEAIALCADLGLGVNIELKRAPGRERSVLEAVARAVAGSPLFPDRLLISPASTVAWRRRLGRACHGFAAP